MPLTRTLPSGTLLATISAELAGVVVSLQAAISPAGDSPDPAASADPSALTGIDAAALAATLQPLLAAAPHLLAQALLAAQQSQEELACLVLQTGLRQRRADAGVAQ